MSPPSPRCIARSFTQFGAVRRQTLRSPLEYLTHGRHGSSKRNTQPRLEPALIVTIASSMKMIGSIDELALSVHRENDQSRMTKFRQYSSPSQLLSWLKCRLPAVLFCTMYRDSSSFVDHHDASELTVLSVYSFAVGSGLLDFWPIVPVNN